MPTRSGGAAWLPHRVAGFDGVEVAVHGGSIAGRGRWAEIGEEGGTVELTSQWTVSGFSG